MKNANGLSAERAAAAELERCLRPADEAFSIPPFFYREERSHDIDHALIQQGWIGIGRSDQVARPGDYLTREIIGRPVIILRDHDGRLRAFANVCRHRGSRLLDGQGNRGAITCPFHGWSYRLDGRLAAAEGMAPAKEFRKEEFGLKPFALAVVAGFLFIHLGDDPEPIADRLGDFEDRHGDWPLDALKTARRRTLEVECNWKLVLEVFSEYYHLPHVHPNSLASIYATPEPGEETRGEYASQFGRTTGTGALLESDQAHALPAMPGLKGRAREGTIYSWVYPNMAFAVGQDALWIYEAYPVSARRCQVVQTICFSPEAMAAADFASNAEAYCRRMDDALDEDIPALERQQRGLNSPDARAGRFSPRLEPILAGFAAWYAGRLRRMSNLA